MKPTEQILKEWKAIAERRTPGKYFIECVHDDQGGINYEVSSPKKGFHVVFSEIEALHERVSPKVQATFYAHSANTYDRLLETLGMALAEFRCTCHYFEGQVSDPCESCITLKKIQAILNGEGK